MAKGALASSCVNLFKFQRWHVVNRANRSLLALSLVLSLLLFKPAPMYILDEVSAHRSLVFRSLYEWRVG